MCGRRDVCVCVCARAFIFYWNSIPAVLIATVTVNDQGSHDLESHDLGHMTRVTLSIVLLS